jgi:hypothetical protein
MRMENSSSDAAQHALDIPMSINSGSFSRDLCLLDSCLSFFEHHGSHLLFEYVWQRIPLCLWLDADGSLHAWKVDNELAFRGKNC